jgi:hypothetical protein
MLLEEDEQSFSTGSIGECIEYMVRKNLFMEVCALAQSDHPHGMFSICLNFMIEIATKIKSMPIIHNDKVHRSLLQMTKCINGYIVNDIIDINDTDMKVEYVRSILEFTNMITGLGTNRDPEISRFFIEEASQYGKSRGT